MHIEARATQLLAATPGLDEGWSQSKVTAASSLEEGREPPYALSEETKAQRGPAPPCTSSPQACASCPQNGSNRQVWRQLAERGWRSPAAPFCVLKGGRSSSTCLRDLLLHAPHRSPLLAGRGLTMPRELQAASSLPSQEQWGHCGRPGKCGQIPGTGSYPLGGSLLPRTLLLHSGRRRAAAAGPSHEPGRKQGQPSRRNTMPAYPVALPSNLAPTNLSGYKMQSDSHRHKAASRHQHAADQTVSRLLSTSSTTPGSPAGSAALSGCATGGLKQEEPGFSHPKVTFQWWVQVLTWDQELLGNLRTPQPDTCEQ